MNFYLEKLAEMAKRTLPYRDRVEVVIVNKDGNVVIVKNKNPDTGETWSGFPGGGVDGQSREDACRNECLEEVGIKIKNIKPTGITHLEEGGMSKKENRHLKYRGSRTTWYIAEHDGQDRSKLGDDNDSRRYALESIKTALESIKSDRPIAGVRRRVILALKP